MVGLLASLVFFRLPYFLQLERSLDAEPIPLGILHDKIRNAVSFDDLCYCFHLVFFLCACAATGNGGEYGAERMTRKVYFIFFSVFTRARSFELCSLVRVRLY